MIFFAVGLSTVMFHSTDGITLGVAGVVLATMMLLTGWPVLATNNLHITSLVKSFPSLMESLSRSVGTTRTVSPRRLDEERQGGQSS